MSASSSTRSPRAVFTTMAPRGSRASRRASSRWRVSGVEGACSESSWLSGSSSSTVGVEDGPLLLLGRQAALVGVVDLHPEAARPAGHRLADAAHAHDAQALAAQLVAHELRGRPSRPATGAEHLLTLVGPPRRPEQQEERHLRGGVGEHLGGVGHHHAAGLRRREVEVLRPHSEAGHDADPCGKAREHAAVHPVRDAADDRVRLLAPGDDLVGGQRAVLGVGDEAVVACRAALHRVRQPPGEEDRVLRHSRSRPPARAPARRRCAGRSRPAGTSGPPG